MGLDKLKTRSGRDLSWGVHRESLVNVRLPHISTGSLIVQVHKFASKSTEIKHLDCQITELTSFSTPRISAPAAKAKVDEAAIRIKVRRLDAEALDQGRSEPLLIGVAVTGKLRQSLFDETSKERRVQERLKRDGVERSALLKVMKANLSMLHCRV